jgi:putative ABC transport system ATP-binding protein
MPAPGSQSDSPAVALDEAWRVYGSGDGRVEAVRGVTHAFRAGRLHAVLGPSGSGKSTLLHLVAGLEKPSRGTVRIDGHDLAALDDAGLARLRRRGVGMVFQFFNLVPSLTVEENVLLPVMLDRKATRADRERLDGLLERLGLAARRGHRPEELSGGERQRAAIARAMLPSPPIVLADEPTGSLDQANGAHIVRILEDLARADGVCVIVVTHDAQVAARADEVLHLHDGRVVKVERRQPA